MKLIDFIKKNKDWKEIITKSPYNITIKEKDDYMLFKYNQIESDMSNDIVKECRGVILDNNLQVVCRPFDKFFNATEPYATALVGDIRAEEKIDGSIMKMWYDKNNWHISTNGMIDAKDADCQSIVGSVNTYNDLFLAAFTNSALLFSDLEQYKDYTIIFELVSPLNRIVVSYKETILYLIGIRNNKTGEEIDIRKIKGALGNVRQPKIFPIKTIDDAINAANKLSSNEEGFVLVDNFFNRVKVKGPAYLELHKIKGNDLSKKNFLSLVLQDKQDDLLAYFPEFKIYIDEILELINTLSREISAEIEKASWHLEKRDFALQIKDWKYTYILFKIYGNKTYDWKSEFLNIENIKKTMKLLGI